MTATSAGGSSSLVTRTRMVESGREVDDERVEVVRQLIEVQTEIETLLARRPADDLDSPVGYESLVAFESALLHAARS